MNSMNKKMSYYLLLIVFLFYQIGGAASSYIFELLGLDSYKSMGYGMATFGVISIFIYYQFLYRRGKELFSFSNSLKKIEYILFSALLLLIFQMMYSAFSSVFFNVGQEDYATNEKIKQMIAAVPFFIPTLVIVGPIIEEITFRYALFHLLEKKISTWVISSVISSIMFALLHGQLISFPFYFLLGMSCSFLYKKTNNLLSPIYLHILINLIAYLSTYY